MTASPARRVAYRTLRRVTSDAAYADRAFRAEAARAALPPRDRAFAQALAYGAIQRLKTLDQVISTLSSRPLDRIDPSVRDALTLGIYQLVYMDAVADHAAVDETVELVKSTAPAAAGFANAVMRRATREATPLVEALPDDTPAQAAVKHSHPDWLVEMWWDELGADETRALLARDNEPPESAIRANTLRATTAAVASKLPVPTRPAPDLPEGLILDEPFDAHGSEQFARGELTPQSRASMLVAHAVAPRPGERLADLCAAPGAKATHLAALTANRASILAVERNPARAEELRRNAARLGARAVEVHLADAREPLPGAPFDRVLLDPPCSALGTLQARPDVRWQRERARIAEFAALQRELLVAAAGAVRPGGTLTYSTCTISTRENEGLMQRFLAEHPEFQAAGLRRLLPHRDGTDGFFIATLERDR